MKFFHLSDLHIGLKLFHRDLLADQACVLHQITEYAKAERPDAVVIAGDLYDRAVPSAEAVETFDRFVSELTEAAPGAAILMISGNHDSAQRINCYRGILQRSNLYMIGLPPQRPEDHIEKVTLTDAFGPVNFYLLPYVRPSMVRGVFTKENTEKFKNNSPEVSEKTVGIKNESPEAYDRTVGRNKDIQETFDPTVGINKDFPEAFDSTVVQRKDFSEVSDPTVVQSSDSPEVFEKTDGIKNESPEAYDPTVGVKSDFSDGSDPTAVLSYEEALRGLLAREEIDARERNVLVSHQFYLPAGVAAGEVERMDSEVQTVGNIDAISAEVLSPFDYAALGHIHKPMKVGSEFIRYCGSPMPYSISEAGQKKGIIVVELGEKGEVSTRVLPLGSPHGVRVVRGTLDEVLRQGCDDYVSVILTDKVDLDVLDMQDRLRAAFPNLLEIRRESVRGADYEKGTLPQKELDPFELCCSFLGELDGGEQELLRDVIRTVQERI